MDSAKKYLTQENPDLSQPAIFLDRDGCLIQERNYLSKLSDIHFYEDVPSTLKRLKDQGFLLLVATNQSGVARGYFSEAFVKEAFDYMNAYLTQTTKVQLDALYYSPYHVDGEFPYNIDSPCRKPRIGMFQQASNQFSIKKENSWMIGDSFGDVAFGKKAGLSPLHLLTGHGKRDAKKVQLCSPIVPQFNSFREAGEHILLRENDLKK